MCSKSENILSESSCFFVYLQKFKEVVTVINKIKLESEPGIEKVTKPCQALRLGKPGTQSNELSRGPSALSFIGGVHIDARALQVLNLKWFRNMARLSQWGGGG